MDKEIRNLLIIGGKEIRKLRDKEFMDFCIFLDKMVSRIKTEDNIKLNKKQKEQLGKLLLGIMKKYKVFDERYHLYLVGKLVDEWDKARVKS